MATTVKYINDNFLITTQILKNILQNPNFDTLLAKLNCVLKLINRNNKITWLSSIIFLVSIKLLKHLLDKQTCSKLEY